MSFAPALPTVKSNRQIPGFASISLPRDMPNSPCYFAVPYSEKDYVGSYAYWYDMDRDRYSGPYPIVDLSSPEDEAAFLANGLSAETNCKFMVHSEGYLVVPMKITLRFMPE